MKGHFVGLEPAKWNLLFLLFLAQHKRKMMRNCLEAGMAAGKDAKGRFTTGNSAWRARQHHGREPKFKTAEELEEMVCNYFEWLDANPLQCAELSHYKGSTTVVKKPVKRVALIQSLCTYLGIDMATWAGWKKEGNDRYRPDLRKVITRAEELIVQDKMEGAVGGFYDSRIIARDLGLVDKKEVGGNMTVKIEGGDADL